MTATERDEPWAPGTPCWVDYVAADLGASRDFYGRLFDWTYTEGGPEYGGYLTAASQGRQVAGIGSAQQGAPSGYWTTYLASDDADADTDRARRAGAHVLVEPFDVGAMGRMSVLVDPTGAGFGLWQSGSHTGFTGVNRPGAVTWTDVFTPDPPTAREFYAAAFGYTFTPMDDGGRDYATFSIDAGGLESGVGGLGAPTDPATPPHWAIYFAVDDADATAALAAELGGRVLSGPDDSPYGRQAFLADPAGAPFVVMAVTSWE